jgi:NAD(P)-dependent dehydrogenase (short-subunit alcohol dehydrogenase family)
VRDFTERVAVVTGAGSGIGRAVAIALAERGARIVAADIDLPAAERTAEDTAGHAYPVDVANAAAMEALAKDVQERHGPASIVVNSAGIGMGGAFLDMDVADWNRVLGVNLWGVIHGCRLFGEQIKAAGRGGHIVNLASAAAFTPQRNMPGYCTSKAAVLSLSQCLRAELAGTGIGVTAVCPGFVATPIVRNSVLIGLPTDQTERLRGFGDRALSRLGYPPERLARRVVTAIERDTAVLSATPDGHLLRALSRLSPGLLRGAARLTIRRST